MGCTSLRRLAVLIALASPLLGLVGCGGSANPTSTAPAPSTAVDRQIAQTAQLRPADLPGAWNRKAASSTPTDACQAINGAKAATTVHGKSPTFSRGTADAQSAIYIYPNAATAGRWFAALNTGSTRACLGAELRSGVAGDLAGQGLNVGAVATGRLTIGELGNERSATRFTVPISSSSQSIDARADLILVRVDRGIAILTLLGTVTPFDHALATRLTEDVVNRLGGGLKHAANAS